VVAELLSVDAYGHLFQTFYVDYPLYVAALIDNFPGSIVKSYHVESLTAKGLLSASFLTWKGFLSWASLEDNKWLKAVVSPINSYFSAFPYFWSTGLVKS
jgi:hypothetical protein